MIPEDFSGLSYRDSAARRWTGSRTIWPNKAMEPIRIAVTDHAFACSAPSIRMAHLGRWAKHMKRLLLFTFCVMASCAFGALNPPDAARAYLLYQYGADVPNISELCVPSHDLWMLRGAAQPQKQKIVQNLKLKIEANGIFMDSIDRDICIIELKHGLIDPEFNLENIYRMHHQLVLQFLYFSLLQDRSELARLVTKVENVSFGRIKTASYGDMDVYEGILALIPIARASAPPEDAVKKSITYRLPLGDQVFTVCLVKQGSTWKIDTDKKVVVPLEFFWK